VSPRWGSIRIIALRFYKYFAPLGLNVHYIYSQNFIFHSSFFIRAEGGKREG
jgi:hypothetical protein